MSQITHTHRTNTAKNSNTCAKNSRTYVHNHASCNAESSGPAGPQHECGLARLLHDTNSNNKQDKPHAHIAQTPRKTRRTGGITRAYTLKIKFSALRGTRGQRGSEMRAKNAHLEKSGGMHSASNRTRIAARITQKHRMSSHRRRDNAPSQLKVHVMRAAGSHRSARRRNARGKLWF